MSQSKRDQATCHLRLIRQELRDIYIELNDEELLITISILLGANWKAPLFRTEVHSDKV